MPKQARSGKSAAERNPERTRGRILSAALKEFAARGFAGARVDAIAGRADINKRMLYHYFGDKENLFREALRRKITERRALAEDAPGDPTENLPFRFELMCGDLDWVKLLTWESVQTVGDKVVEEKFRREGTAKALARVRQQQAQGELTSDFDERHLLLAKLSLAMFPAAFPQLTRLIMGKAVSDPKFQSEYSEFLKKFAEVFRPQNKNP